MVPCARIASRRPSLRFAGLALAGLALLAPAGIPAHAADEPGSRGLDFPSNGQTVQDIRFRFTGADLIPMYPATYIWRVKLRPQQGYYTTFFWGPDGPFTGKSFFGCHPYPDGGGHATATHKWELSIDGNDFVTDANGHSTQLGYDVWRTQALRAYDNGSQKAHEFYWDLPDTAKVIRVLLPRSYGAEPPLNPALTFGDAPWSLGNERLSGVLRGIQLYAARLSLKDVLGEIAKPLGTAAGAEAIWYLNLNPAPDDLADKSGKGHHPAWVTSARAKAWSAAGVPILLPRAPADPASAPIALPQAFVDALGRTAPRAPAAMPILPLP